MDKKQETIVFKKMKKCIIETDELYALLPHSHNSQTRMTTQMIINTGNVLNLISVCRVAGESILIPSRMGNGKWEMGD